ncbi:MAG: TonB-dependent receptor, partial [Pseudomonadota bacterium]|nr:TonB-dependent receptor [Pseudomonadota bacterium]
RKESLSQINAPFLSSGDIIGGAGAITSLEEVHRKVYAGFAEVNVPIIPTVEVNVAARYDHYNDFGNTTNPKLTVRWQPSRQVLVRGAWGTGFRAPTLSDLYQPALFTNTNGSFDDPLRCPITQSVFDCNLQFNSQRGGNRALKPEKSDQWYAGIVFEPVVGSSIGLDYFKIKVKNLITNLDATNIFDNFSLYSPTNVVRRAPDPQFPNLPGQILYVIENLVNVGKQETEGFDIDIVHRIPATSIGRFTARFNGTYTMHFKQSTFDAADYPDYVGSRGPDGSIARWRHYVAVDWSSGPFGATVSESYQHSYSEPDLVNGGSRRVSPYEIWDLQGRYEGFKNFMITLGVRNLFDRAPPVSNQNNNFQVGYDPSYGDPRGRMYYGTLRYSFK